MAIIEVTGVHQKTLENMYLRKIREINAIIKQENETYNNWETADERLKSRYSREEFKEYFIGYQRERRRGFIMKLRNVRNGYIYE